MLTELMRQWSRGIINPIAKLISWTGISPDGVTLVGFLLMVVVGLVISQGHLQLAGALLILAGIFDAIDGALARLLDRATRFGAFLDSTMDRFSEAAIFLGVLIHFQRQDASTEVMLTYATIVGSLMVSYTRARAEGVHVQIKGGFLTRLERMLIVIVGLIANQMTLALWILAPLTNLTALQRIWLTWRATRQEAREE
jgi:CDP-diacylglycerol--glycerol-3-phosphate 3-phosphatidyltransferase